MIAPPEAANIRNDDAIDKAAHAAASWMERSQRPDGSYVYEYDASTNTSPDDYNEVRHAGVTMALYQAAGKLHDREALSTGDRALDWMNARLVRRHDWAALSPNRESASLGASALMLVGLIERRLVTGNHDYDSLMHELARFAASLQNEDGSFARSLDLAKEAPDEGASPYYPGESLWAFALMHNAFPGEGWDKKAISALDYIATRREEVDHERVLPFNDQWAAYGIAEISRWGVLSQAHVDYTHRLAARFGLLARTEAQIEGSSYGRFFREERARGASAGTWLEALSALWRASFFDSRLADLREPVATRATSLASILVDRQMTHSAAESYPVPGLVEGAWLSDESTRIDDQQHAFSGLLYTEDLLRGISTREPSERVIEPAK